MIYISELTDWKTKHFRGLFSWDNLPKKMQSIKTGIINLQDSIGSRTHWVCYRNVDGVIYVNIWIDNAMIWKLFENKL